MGTTTEDTTVIPVEHLYGELVEQTRMVQSTRTLLTSLAARRRETVVALRAAGQSHKQIADRLGITKSAVQQILS
jgi:DNA-directed RNA polymerase specialized sigma24 family protein